MSLQTNKEDFDQALYDLEFYQDELNCVVNETISNALERVISEYRSHLQGDIEEMMSKYDELLERKEELDEEVARLNNLIRGQ